MAKRRFGILILFLCFCFCLLPWNVQAASTTEAKEPIATQNHCLLTIAYSCDGIPMAGQTVKLYQVAEVSADYQYSLTAPFADSGLMLNGIQTNGEWDAIRTTLESLVLANGVEPVKTAVTDEDGIACFETLKPGLYLASSVCTEDEDFRYYFESALVALPGLDNQGHWQDQVSITAKPKILPPVDFDTELELKVLKLWKGDENRTDRPKSIAVEIFRNGVPYETVVLSEENHWSYSWTAKDDGAGWNVVERNVPADYTMTVSVRETTFVLTNTRNSDDPYPSPPKTGDTSSIFLHTILMYLSGILLIIFGFAGKRKHHEERI